jgi:hypothetical protein
MRYIFFFAILILIISGCDDNPASPNSDTIHSGSLQYTFSTPKTTYTVSDILKANVTVLNTGSVPDTIAVGDGIFQWSLQDQNGQTIIIGGGHNDVIAITIIKPGELKKIYSINQLIADSSGKNVSPGSYILKAKLYTSMSFSLNLMIK